MNAIPDSAMTHQLLFAPYSKDYHVAEEVRQRMTEQEFYNKCYVDPDFTHEADRIKESINQEVDYIDEADKKPARRLAIPSLTTEHGYPPISK